MRGLERLAALGERLQVGEVLGLVRRVEGRRHVRPRPRRRRTPSSADEQRQPAPLRREDQPDAREGEQRRDDEEQQPVRPRPDPAGAEQRHALEQRRQPRDDRRLLARRRPVPDRRAVLDRRAVDLAAPSHPAACRARRRRTTLSDSAAPRRPRPPARRRSPGCRSATFWRPPAASGSVSVLPAVEREDHLAARQRVRVELQLHLPRPVRDVQAGQAQLLRRLVELDQEAARADRVGAREVVARDEDVERRAAASRRRPRRRPPHGAGFTTGGAGRGCSAGRR